MERVAEPRVSRMGSRDLPEVRALIARAAGIDGSRVDTRLPRRTGVVRRDGKAVGIVAVERRFGDLVIRAFHFLPEARDDLAPAYRERLRAGAAAESRKVRLLLRNADAWAEEFLAPIVVPAAEPEGDGAGSGPLDSDPLPFGLSHLLGWVGSHVLVSLAIGRTVRLGMTGIFLALAGIYFLGLAAIDAVRARRAGEVRVALPRHGFVPTATGVFCLLGGGLLPMTEVRIVGWWWTAVSILAAGLFLLRMLARRPGARAGGITLPGHVATIAWEDVAGWRRTGDGVVLDFARARPGRWEKHAVLDLPRPTANALEAFLRRVVPEVSPPPDPGRSPPNPRTS